MIDVGLAGLDAIIRAKPKEPSATHLLLRELQFRNALALSPATLTNKSLSDTLSQSAPH
jgi:hypothetical protein